MTVGADAHAPEHIAYGFDRAYEILKDIGFDSYSIKFFKKKISRRNLHEEKKIRKEAAELFAHAGDGYGADAWDELYSVCRYG